MRKFVQLETMALPPSLGSKGGRQPAYRMRCPRCQDELRLRPGAFARCSCGHRWRLRISAAALILEV